ncbi:NAD(P)-binding protein [Lentithecium fluviatile CBS 122367]|uniref:NAD(P)-binding protein n=1 Tax=Lentithecium fluviatile CBS 122367 TaxID=1168545 RepID=A0A6G1J1Q2_9PLEO|nr:NAD(P)-binding protein [Lentithecium fluviatile CBS 122367]
MSAESSIFVQCDVKSYASQASLFEAVWKRWCRLDVLIANAGCVDRGSHYNFGRRHAAIDDLPPGPDTTCTDIDLIGTIYGTTLATHFMRNNPHGRGGKIIVTGSLIGILSYQTFPEYCAAKATMHHRVRTMGPILRQREGITINCVMPGGIETPAMPVFSKAFRPEQMTLKSTLLSAYDAFLDDAAHMKTGQLVEAAHEKLIEWGHPGYKSGAFAKRTEAVFEPWFELMHGERSGIAGTLPDWPDQNLKIGDGVVNFMKKTPGWRVRAVTRNPESDAAKKLAADGIEVVQADFDDEASLHKAFEARPQFYNMMSPSDVRYYQGVHAVYAVTQWWEHIFKGKGQDEAGKIEEEQGMNIARAAAATRTLEHYIWSTTPSAKHMLRGKLLAPHMDYKANFDARVQSELPNLAAVTSYLCYGYYPQNMAFFPLCKPIDYPGTGQYIQALPTKADAKILLVGDMTVNPGIWVRQVLATGGAAYGKYANVALEWTFQVMVDVWSEITGKKCVFTEMTMEAATKLLRFSG